MLCSMRARSVRPLHGEAEEEAMNAPDGWVAVATVERIQLERNAACTANEALRGQIAALREALLDERGSRGFPSRGLSVALADTEAAAREHDAAVRAQAFEEAAGIMCDRCGTGYEFNGTDHNGLPCEAAALREKARKP